MAGLGVTLMHQDRVQVVSIVVVVLVCRFYLLFNVLQLALNFCTALLHHLGQLLHHLLRLCALLSLRINTFPDIGQVGDWVISPLPRSLRKIWSAAQRHFLPERDALHEVSCVLDALNKLVLVHLFESFPVLDALLLELGGGTLDGGYTTNIVFEHLVDVDALVEYELLVVLHNLLLLLVVCHAIQRKKEYVRWIFNPELVFTLHLLRGAYVDRTA